MNGFADIVECIRETDPNLFVTEFEALREFVSDYMGVGHTPTAFNEALAKLCSVNSVIRRPIISCICRTSAVSVPSGEVYINSNDLPARFWGALYKLNLSEDDKKLVDQLTILCAQAEEEESCYTYHDDIFEEGDQNSPIQPPPSDPCPETPPGLSQAPLPPVDLSTLSIPQVSEESSYRMPTYSLSQYPGDGHVADASISGEDNLCGASEGKDFYEDDFEPSVEAGGGGTLENLRHLRGSYPTSQVSKTSSPY